MADRPNNRDYDGNYHRTNIGITIAIVALLVSVATFLYPIWERSSTHSEVIHKYVEALVGTGSSAYVARGMAAEGSRADDFARATGVLWEAIADSNTDIESLAAGSVTSKGHDSYEVCYPALDIFTSDCSTFSDFEFNERDRVARFTIDGQPVEQLFRSYEYDKSLTSSDGSNQMRAYRAGMFLDSDSKEKVILLWIDRGVGVSSAGQGNLTLSSVSSQNGQEAEMPVIASYFPETFFYHDAYYAAVRVPDEARFLWVCWDGTPEGETPCDWVYSIR